MTDGISAVPGGYASAWTAACAVEVPADSARSATFARRSAVVVALFTIVVLAVTCTAHRTPLYFGETDLLAEHFPAASALARGSIEPRHLVGDPGYPMMLAVAGAWCGGDQFLAARFVSAIATGVAAAFAAWWISRFAGVWVAGFALAGLLLNPVLLRYAIEAGPDAPAAASMLVAVWALSAARSRWGVAGAGLLAGVAMMTRWQAGILVPIGALLLLRHERPARAIPIYVIAALLPLLAWMGACWASAGQLPRLGDPLAVAYELHGRGLAWESFERRHGARFASVVAAFTYHPGVAAASIGWNLVVHRWRDLFELVPIWIGLWTPLGLLLAIRRTEWGAPLLVAAGCAVALATTAYSTRLSLVLLPIVLATAGLALRATLERCAELSKNALPRWSAAFLAAIALAGSGVVMVRDVASRLADSPEETRRAGAWLRERGLAGGILMSRKPHAAWYAGMIHRPLPAVASMLDLHERARAAGARYLLCSPIEVSQRPVLAVLGDSAVRLPGFDPLAYERVPSGRFFALYRVENVEVDSTTMSLALEDAVAAYGDRHATDPTAQLYTAMQLVELGRAREAIGRLEPLVRAGAQDPAVFELLSNAHLEVGELDAARRQCRAAMAHGKATAWHDARLAAIACRQGDWYEAARWFERAVAKEPANLDHLEQLGHAYIQLARFRPAASVFERCIRLAPEQLRYRRFAIGAYQFAGEAERARSLFDEGVRSGFSAAALLEGESTAPAASR